MRHNWLLGVVGLLLVLCSYAGADMLCREQSGAVVVRGECRKAETRLNATALGLVGPPGLKGEKGERGPRGQQGRPGETGALAPRTPEPVSAGDSQTRPLWWLVWLWAGTVGVLGFYTFATQKLRRAAQTQSELQLRPLVIFEPTEGKGLCVRNIGNNTALNVRVVPFKLAPSVMAAFPRSVAFLGKGETALLQRRTATTIEGESVGDDWFDVLHPSSELVREEADAFLLRPSITVEFENVQGQCYFVQESLLNGDIEIINSGPVIPPPSDKLRRARQRLQTTWQQLQPARQKLQTSWQQLQAIRQKLQTVWRQRWRKMKGVNARTANEEKE